MSVVAVIPARGGSKGIPLKNIAPLGGIPLLAYTIRAARATKVIDRIILSTDSQVIAQVGIDYGLDVPFLRPERLARDETPGIDPIVHAAEWVRDHENLQPEYVIVLQPTSPFRTAGDIELALQLAIETRADSVVSVGPVAVHPFWMKRMQIDGVLVDFAPNAQEYACRQDLPPLFALNGAIYIVRTEILLRERTLFPDRTYGYVMPSERSLDIDSAWDLYRADLVMRDRADFRGPGWAQC